MDLVALIQAAFILHPISFLEFEKALTFLSKLRNPIHSGHSGHFAEHPRCVHFSSARVFACINFRQVCILPSISKESITEHQDIYVEISG